MKHSEKKAIYIWTFIAIVLFIAMLFYIIFSLYPNYIEIEKEKVVFAGNIEAMTKLEKAQIDFK